jgi:hypothetical protein
LLLFFALFCPAGCGDDDGNYKPVDPYRSITSPENVIYNFALSFDKMNYDKFAPLIHEDFTHVFTEDDVHNYPGYIPQDGIWGKAEFLSAVEIMLTPEQYSCPDYLEADNVSLDLAFSGDPAVTSEEGVPPGTIKGFVTLDLRVNTVGTTDYLVNSRPAFYFAPDSTSMPVRYYLWRIDDAPFGQPTSSASDGHAQAGVGSHVDRKAERHKAAGPVFKGTSREAKSFGYILAYHYRRCI